MNKEENLILVADDDPVLRMILIKYLSELGYIGHTAENGEEAVLMAAKIPYRLILMDIQMPRMDGVTATAEIRKSATGKTVPIIALTATTDKASCLASGMNDFLSKPISKDTLNSAITTWTLPLSEAHPRPS